MLKAAGFTRGPAAFHQQQHQPKCWAQLYRPAESDPLMTSAKPNPYDMTDTANADRLVKQSAGKLRYCPDMGRWLTFDGTRWIVRPDDTAAWQTAREAIESIERGDSEALAKHMLHSLAENRLAAMVRLARRHPALQVGVDQLDADPYALNTPDGVVDLNTGHITACTPSQLHTKATGCGVATTRRGKVDSDPQHPMWDDFLYDTFGGDEFLIGYMQELAGAGAVGNVQSHVLPFLNGPGGNGKSVFTDVMLNVFGDYGGPCPANFLLAGRDKHETEIAQLRGLRLAISSEINQGSTFDEAKTKLLTGGDMLTGRFMRQDFFKFVPTHSLWLVGNHKPEVPAGGASFWRRLRLIPFDHQVSKDKMIEGLAEKLVAQEGPAILAWVIQGAHRFIHCGLSATPKAVEEATGEYATQEDPIKRFIDECCNVDDAAAETPPAVLRGAYLGWAKRTGEKPLSMVAFGRAMSAAGHKAVRTAGTGSVRVHAGLRVKASCLPTWSSDFLSANSASRN